MGPHTPNFTSTSRFTREVILTISMASNCVQFMAREVRAVARAATTRSVGRYECVVQHSRIANTSEIERTFGRRHSKATLDIFSI